MKHPTQCERRILRFINGNQKIQGLLWDMDMMPEQLERGTLDWTRMLILCDYIQKNSIYMGFKCKHRKVPEMTPEQLEADNNKRFKAGENIRFCHKCVNNVWESYWKKKPL